MTKIYIKYKNENAIRQIDETLKIMETLKFSSLTSPYDFNLKGVVNEANDTIEEVSKSLNDFKTWLINSNDSYEKLINELQGDLKRINNFELKKNTGMIK